jgi:hypothetical protein
VKADIHVLPDIGKANRHEAILNDAVLPLIPAGTMRHRVADGPKSGLSSQQVSRLEVERDQDTGVGSEGPHLCSAVQVLGQDPATQRGRTA